MTAFEDGRAYAQRRDLEDPMGRLRGEFAMPTKSDLKRKKLRPGRRMNPAFQSGSKERFADDGGAGGVESERAEPCTYLCGNSLGLQPKRTAEYIGQYLETWATKGVYGHFQELEDAAMPPWIDLDGAAAGQMAKIVGGLPSEVAVMGTLTVNLHLLMASFYRPTTKRHKIIIEGGAFPSDHYAVMSQIAFHALPSSSLILIEPPNSDSPYLPTGHILSIIDRHADETALLLLPGIQFYSGQYFDIPTITAHAQSHNIIVGWDMAHAVGNVPLELHNWDVDFAAWCSYKYLNSGAGAIGGLFVHEKHGRPRGRMPREPSSDQPILEPMSSASFGEHRSRLSGWWGSPKASRFSTTTPFVPVDGACGFQLSNPSALDTSAVLASLSIFAETDIAAIRSKSVELTGYLEYLLIRMRRLTEGFDSLFTVVTPSNPAERGAQLSLRLQEGLLKVVMRIMEDEGVVVDERKPDVLRVAPAPLYNSFEDVWRFANVFAAACRTSKDAKKIAELESLFEKQKATIE